MHSNSHHPPPRRGRKIMFSALVLAAVAGALEIGARVGLGGDPPPLVTTTLAGSAADRAPEVFRFDSDLFWRPRANLRRTGSAAWGDATNSRGFRGTVEYAADAGRAALRVACVGDSCTYGLGLPAEQAWPAQLGDLSGFEVVNAGVPGYSSWQGRRWFEESCADLAPDVVVVQFGNNDCSPWPSPDGDGFRFLSDSERHRQISARSLGGRSRFLSWLVAPSASRDRAPVVPSVPFDFDAVRARVEVPEFRENLDALARTAPTVVHLAWIRRAELSSFAGDPLSARHGPYRESVLARRRRGGIVVDVGDVFRRSGERAAELYVDDVHASRRGSALVAEAVLDAIRRSGADGYAGDGPGR